MPKEGVIVSTLPIFTAELSMTFFSSSCDSRLARGPCPITKLVHTGRNIAVVEFSLQKVSSQPVDYYLQVDVNFEAIM